MRTTLDIDDDVLQAAKERARVEGKVVSELIRQALTQAKGPLDVSSIEIVDGIPVLPSRGGVVTHEQVRRLIEDVDQEDARRALGN